MQHLIGPEIFPFWWAAIKATTAVILGIWAVLVILVLIGGEPVATARGTDDPSLVGVLVFAFGLITLVCALIERFGKTALLQKWKPAELPPPEGKSKSRFERAVEIGMNVVFMLWWIGAIRFSPLLPEYRMSIELAPIWDEVFWPILIYAGLDVAANVFALVRPGATAVHRAVSLVHNLLGVALLGYVYQAGHWLVVRWDVWTPEVRAQVQANFDVGMRIGIAATILLMLSLAAFDAWRLWQIRQARQGSPATV
ncbi:MAG: hypothetical protein JNK30_20685 [Phenylobacterium sp.]|uniref:hypothetical protein n=1 Tax=Phenylobacterium sp. TaxID=1871053 RepID=UPI001A3EDE2B|nr:hypothetical protein [Phenylobacterium sp.]MBL8773815.1 hypothetical protein [Phenylobacterium sp.]